MILGESEFFEALSHIMWDMEVDILLEKDKTLALAADYAPKCRKQRKRLEAMYECGAIDKIETALSDASVYAEKMWEAVDLICEYLETDEKRAVFAVNQIIDLWDGRYAKLDDAQQGDDEMIFLQDVTESTASGGQENPQPEQTEEKNDENKDESKDENNSGGGENSAGAGSGEPQPSVLSKLVKFWCFSDCEEGRPHLITCPIGWLCMLLCCVLGAFMVYDIPFGDKFVPPVFVFMYVVLIGKRLYRSDSVGRLSIGIFLFYAAAAARTLWIGGTVPIRGVLIVAAALVVFNNGRFGVLLDGEKRRAGTAYLLITLFSAVITASVYAIQNVKL